MSHRSRAIIELTKGRILEFTREPSALVFVVAIPVIWLLLLGFAFSDPKPARLGVPFGFKAHVEDILSRRIPEECLEGNIEMAEGSYEDHAKNFGAKKLDAVIADDLKEIRYFDSTEKGVIAKLYARMLLEATHQAEIKGAIRCSPERENKPSYVEFLLPGLLAMSLFTTSLFGTGMTIVANRREGILKRYLVTPMPMSTYILSHIFGRFFIFLIEAGTLLCVGRLVFDFEIKGSALAFLAYALLGVASFTAFGILLGSRTKNSSAYHGIVNLVTLPMMFLSGVWFSTDSFPSWLLAISKFLPLSALAEGLRAISLEGAGLSRLGFGASVLLVLGLISSVLSLRLFRWF